jgi:hypothetical protein
MPPLCFSPARVTFGSGTMIRPQVHLPRGTAALRLAKGDSGPAIIAGHTASAVSDASILRNILEPSEADSTSPNRRDTGICSEYSSTSSSRRILRFPILLDLPVITTSHIPSRRTLDRCGHPIPFLGHRSQLSTLSDR